MYRNSCHAYFAINILIFAKKKTLKSALGIDFGVVKKYQNVLQISILFINFYGLFIIYIVHELFNIKKKIYKKRFFVARSDVVCDDICYLRHLTTHRDEKYHGLFTSSFGIEAPIPYARAP